MKSTPELTAFCQARSLKSTNEGGDWFIDEYNAAIERIRDYSPDIENPYFGSQSDDWCAIPPEPSLSRETVLMYGDGTEFRIDEARKMAFDLLVLSDLAEAHWGVR